MQQKVGALFSCCCYARRTRQAISGCEVIVEASFDIREIHTPLALSYVQEAHVQI